MEFEFDPKKSASNQEKHGIDFVSAQLLWMEPTVTLISKNPTEERKLVIGLIAGVPWTAIITERKGRIRIISCRRSRENEREIYEENYG